MRKKSIGKLAAAVATVMALQVNSAQALNTGTDLNSYTSGVAPTTVCNITKITTTNNIDLFNWSSFNLGKNEVAKFIFSAEGQTAVNYINPGMNPSFLMGKIKGSGARGNVMFFNPNGITISKNTRVMNLNTFFVSTNQFDGISDNKILFSEPVNTNVLNIQKINLKNVNNAHFVAPGIVFNNTRNISTGGSFSIRAIGGGEFDVLNNAFSNEQGIKSPALSDDIVNIDIGKKKISSKDITIQAKGAYEGYADIQISGKLEANTAIAGENGSIYIMASNSSTAENSGAQMILNGKISGENADVNLESKRVVLNGDIDASGNNGGIITIDTRYFDHYGSIKAIGNEGQGGVVDIQATKYTAVSDALIDASGKTKGGDITLLTDYEILTSGTYKAASNEGKGGNIKISAPLLKQLSVNIDASGHTGGGEILLGGEFKGGMYLEEDVIPNSMLNTLSDGSTIKANCTGENGDGGTVIVWSDHTMNAFGTIEAKGGSDSGEGGLVEISGQEVFNFNADVDTKGGTLMLDPKNIIIDDSEIGGIVYNSILSDGSSFLDTETLELSGDDSFGTSIAIHDNLLAIGAFADDTGGNNRGACYLFSFDYGTTYDNLTLNTKLVDGSSLPGGGTLSLNDSDYFGQSTALYDNLLAIGAYGDDTGGSNRGAVYLFSFDTDTTYENLALNTKLADGSVLPGGGTLSLNDSDYFGTSVALYDNLLAIGTQGDNTGGSDKGAAYLFSFDSSTTYDNLTLNTKFADGSSLSGGGTLSLNDGDHFGSSIALYDNLLAVGAYRDDTGGTSRGAAYLFSFDSGTIYENIALNTKLTDGSVLPGGGGSLSLSNFDYFGSSIALYDNLLAVGAYGEGNDQGAAYLFSFDSGTTYDNLALNTKLADGSVLPGGGGSLSLNEFDYFGSGIALYDNLLAVGAYGDGSDQGAAYLFSFDSGTTYNNLALNRKLNNGSSVKTVSSLNFTDYDYFGSSIALYDNLLAVGARGDNTGGSDRGAVYLFSFDGGTTYDNLALNIKLADSSLLPGGGGPLSLNNDDNFGDGVALHKNLLAVGASGDNTGATDCGAAYLFSFDSGSAYDNLTLNTKLADGYTFPGGGGTLSLDGSSFFGWSVALSDNLLAVGVPLDSTGGLGTGAVYLISFDSGTTYNNLALNTKLADGYTFPGGGGTLSLQSHGQFGSSVALYENLLAVGARFSTTYSKGSAYLFSFDSGTTYDNLALNLRLTNGTSLAGGDTLSLSNFDNFGASVALYDNLLAVGAEGDENGAAYLFSFDTGTTYDNLGLDIKIENGTELASGSILSLNANNFGSSVTLYDNLLAVGMSGNDTGGNHAGAAYLFNILDQNIGNYGFASYPDGTLYLAPDTLAALLTEQDVILQANNDITFLQDIAGGNYDLTVQAGRSIDIQEDILVAGDLTLIANETVSEGVFDAYRDAGAAEITIDRNATIGVGSGDLTIHLKAGDDKTHFESGDIVLDDIKANKILVLNEGLTAGSDVIINKDAALVASGKDNPLVLSTANGTFTNNSDANALSAVNDRWLVYSDSPGNTTFNGLTPDSEVYRATYVTDPPAALEPGNTLLFANAPVTPSSPVVTGDDGGGGTAAAIAIPTGVAGLGVIGTIAADRLLAATPLFARYPAIYPSQVTGAAGLMRPAISNDRQYIIQYDENGNVKYLEPKPAATEF